MLRSQETQKVRVGIDLALKEVNLDDFDIFLGVQFHIKVLFSNKQFIILLAHTYPIQIIVNIVKSITSPQSCTGLRTVGWSSKTWRRTRRTLWATEACFGSLSSDGGLASWRWRRQRQWWELFSVCTKYLISFTFLLDTLSMLDFDEVFSSLLILLLRNMFNWEIWVMYIYISVYISLLNYQMWVKREEDDPYQSIEEQLLSIDEVEVFRGQKNRLVLLL